MRICILTSGHIVYDNRIYYKEILSLRKKYDDIYIIAPGDKDFITEDGIQVLCFQKRKYWFDRVRPMREMYKLALSVNAQVYHAHEPDSFQVATKLKERLGSKIIYDSHEYHPEGFAEHFVIGKQLVKKIVGYYEKKLSKKSDFIISVNSLLVDKFKNYNDNVALLPNYPVLENEENENNHAEVPTFVYVGGISKERGILKVLESIQYVKGKYEYIFIGQFWDEDTKNEVESYIRKYLPDQHITFTGQIPHKEVLPYLEKAWGGFILFQPTNWRYVNSEPIKLFEYMMKKVPVIASDFPMMRSIVKGCNCGILVDPNDSLSIAQAMDTLAKDKETNKEMGVNGYHAVIKRYNWGTLEDTLYNVYEKLC